MITSAIPKIMKSVILFSCSFALLVRIFLMGRLKRSSSHSKSIIHSYSIGNLNRELEFIAKVMLILEPLIKIEILKLRFQKVMKIVYYKPKKSKCHQEIFLIEIVTTAFYPVFKTR